MPIRIGRCAFSWRRISTRYAVSGAYLFGSRARGDFRADSDADVAILLRGPQGAFLDTKLDLADIAYDVLLETGIRIQPLPVWEAEWAHPEAYSNPRLSGTSAARASAFECRGTDGQGDTCIGVGGAAARYPLICTGTARPRINERPSANR